jgi:hypothetical protein
MASVLTTERLHGGAQRDRCAPPRRRRRHFEPTGEDGGQDSPADVNVSGRESSDDAVLAHVTLPAAVGGPRVCERDELPSFEHAPCLHLGPLKQEGRFANCQVLPQGVRVRLRGWFSPPFRSRRSGRRRAIAAVDPHAKIVLRRALPAPADRLCHRSRVVSSAGMNSQVQTPRRSPPSEGDTLAAVDDDATPFLAPRLLHL